MESPQNEGQSNIFGNQDKKFFKTKMCKYFPVGKCTMGEECRFAHNERDLRQKPDMRYTAMCWEYEKHGQCFKGDSCGFAHYEHQLRPDPTSEVDMKSPQEMKERSQPDMRFTALCHEYTRVGRCRRGKACRFAHSIDDLRPDPLGRPHKGREGLAQLLTTQVHLHQGGTRGGAGRSGREGGRETRSNPTGSWRDPLSPASQAMSPLPATPSTAASPERPWRGGGGGGGGNLRPPRGQNQVTLSNPLPAGRNPISPPPVLALPSQPAETFSPDHRKGRGFGGRSPADSSSIGTSGPGSYSRSPAAPLTSPQQNHMQHHHGFSSPMQNIPSPIQPSSSSRHDQQGPGQPGPSQPVPLREDPGRQSLSQFIPDVLSFLTSSAGPAAAAAAGSPEHAQPLFGWGLPNQTSIQHQQQQQQGGGGNRTNGRASVDSQMVSPLFQAIQGDDGHQSPHGPPPRETDLVLGGGGGAGEVPGPLMGSPTGVPGVHEGFDARRTSIFSDGGVSMSSLTIPLHLQQQTQAAPQISPVGGGAATTTSLFTPSPLAQAPTPGMGHPSPQSAPFALTGTGQPIDQTSPLHMGRLSLMMQELLSGQALQVLNQSQNSNGTTQGGGDGRPMQPQQPPTPVSQQNA
uniref:C3H1-type domain-containing protein n=1 Tax=Chromera velia CCMP2878 TaxID=1169474 RepID=A0A0G4GWW5_9ALVE|eukprot:Cvel_23729.t1-p1 / transcript=Cvel_23729.t1 / gene=Cvel_23729 / organism=Chromera_velia_CCMP2878 / gene_product=mRNA 3'-end-processing protein yth1, putative / transcript_product=mRNA 3'-end-processing protein yth1, putative / location=Cvel_scaffold2480:13398-17302(+) / protein_length=628 / sequence_SO=supercontig / SO=protein_coding / is_pseudo=false